MGLLEGSMGSGGGSNSAESSSWSHGEGSSDSWSRTYGTEASLLSAQQAAKANEVQQNFFDQSMEFNAREAEKQRAFNAIMGNTIYTRSMKNMLEAGINPILAAQNGLSGANVNSGVAASASAPSAFMGQTFADQASASHSQWSSDSESKSKSSGTSWQNSESGLATGLQLLGSAIGGAIEKLNGAQTINVALDGIDKIFNKDKGNVDKQYSDFAETVADMTGASKSKVKDTLMTKDSSKYKALTNAVSGKNNPALYKSPGRINEASWGKK